LPAPMSSTGTIIRTRFSRRFSFLFKPSTKLLCYLYRTPRSCFGCGPRPVRSRLLVNGGWRRTFTQWAQRCSAMPSDEIVRQFAACVRERLLPQKRKPISWQHICAPAELLDTEASFLNCFVYARSAEGAPLDEFGNGESVLHVHPRYRLTSGRATRTVALTTKPLPVLIRKNGGSNSLTDRDDLGTTDTLLFCGLGTACRNCQAQDLSMPRQAISRKSRTQIWLENGQSACATNECSQIKSASPGVFCLVNCRLQFEPAEIL
jgi:hypothetical protein